MFDKIIEVKYTKNKIFALFLDFASILFRIGYLNKVFLYASDRPNKIEEINGLCVFYSALGKLIFSAKVSIGLLIQ